MIAPGSGGRIGNYNSANHASRLEVIVVGLEVNHNIHEVEGTVT